MLKKVLKWFGLTVVLVVVVLITAVMLRQNRKFDAPYPKIKASTDSSIIAKGKYMVRGPAHCADCHAPTGDRKKIDAGEEVPLTGGMQFALPIADIYSKNLTPDKETGIGRYTDEELARLLRYNVRADGTVLIDFMSLHNASDEDMTAIISYLRSLPPVKNPIKENSYNFMGKVIKAFMLEPVFPDGEPPKTTVKNVTPEYGKYLANNIANCYGCHTNRDLKTGAFIGKPYAGGFKIDSWTPGVFVVSPNITADPKTGKIATWSEDDFVKRFHTGKTIVESVMPWGPYKSMSDDDLRAIYRYLKTVTPVEQDNGPTVTTQ